MVASTTVSSGPPTSDIAAILESDPKYSDFVTIISAAGLWPELRAAKGITVFAPTNDAFNRTFPNWADVVNLSEADQNGTSTFARERLVESGGVRGVYLPTAFAGKRQRVMTMGGTVFVADGTVPGQISLAVAERAPPSGMGYPVHEAPHLAMLGTPMVATNGIIYPADAVIVH